MKISKGKFKPKNPQKYKGNPTEIFYRSSWEFRYMMELDHNKDVISWSSEEIAIPYRSPLDGEIHRYFVDFFVERLNKNGKTEKFLIEIKPNYQTKEPEMTPRKRKKTYLTEVMTYGINKAKWKAAESFCEYKGWKFQILTEIELGIKN